MGGEKNTDFATSNIVPERQFDPFRLKWKKLDGPRKQIYSTHIFDVFVPVDGARSCTLFRGQIHIGKIEIIGIRHLFYPVISRSSRMDPYVGYWGRNMCWCVDRKPLWCTLEFALRINKKQNSTKKCLFNILGSSTYIHKAELQRKDKTSCLPRIGIGRVSSI